MTESLLRPKASSDAANPEARSSSDDLMRTQAGPIPLKLDVPLSEAALRALVEYAPDGVFVADLDGRYRYVNAAGCRMLGYSRDELVGKTILDLIPAEDVDKLARSRDAMLHGAQEAAEWLLRRKDGAWLPVEITATILGDGQWLGFVRDISERKKLQAEREALFERIEAERRSLRTLMDALPVGVFLLEGEAITANACGEDMLGTRLSPSGGSGQFANLVCYPDGKPVPREEFFSSRVMRDGRTITGEEYLIRRADGSELPVLGGAAPIVDATGKIVGIVAVLQDISERMRMEDRLRAKKQLLQTVFDLLPVGVWIADETGQCIQTNDAAARIWAGAPHASLVEYGQYKGWRLPGEEPIAPDEWAMARAVTKGETVIREIARIQCFDGTHKTVLLSATPLRDDDGRITGAITVNEDISELYEAQERVRKAEQLMRAVFDLLPVGVWITDETGRITQNNPAGERVWRGARYVDIPEYGEYKGWYVGTNEPIAAEDWALARAYSKGETTTGELIRIQCFDGSFKTIINSAAPLRGPKGEITGAIVVNEDITELYEAQEQQRASEQLMRTVFNLLPVGVWVADREGKIKFGNPAGDRIWGGTQYVGPKEYGVYKGWWVETGEPVATDEWGLNRALRGETSRSELIRIQCFDGSFKTVINSAAPIRSETGEIVGAIAANEDVTALQHTQEQLRHAVQERERILAVVAHDLRTPLLALMSYAAALELGASKLPFSEKVQAGAAALRDIGRQMAAMVDDLLAVAVSEAGGQAPLKLTSVSPARLLTQAAQGVRPLMMRRGLDLDIYVAEGLPLLRADSSRILRVLSNLLDNALKFTEPPGRVTMKAESTGAGILFSVANSGAPVSSEQLDAMFEPFWQAERREQGAGLGLSICRSIVMAHGGTIWAEPAEGQRMRVCFVLPRVTADVARSQAVRLGREPE